MSDFDELVLESVRSSTKHEGAMWTGDIAWGIGAGSTGAVRRALARLEKRGLVRRVVIGNPTSWEAVSTKP